jgi:hypothetical protein
VIGAAAGRVWLGVRRAFIPANRAVASSLLIGPRRSAVRLLAMAGGMFMVRRFVLRWESLDALRVLQEARLAGDSTLRTIRRSSYTQCTFANFPVPHWKKIRQPIPKPLQGEQPCRRRDNLMNALPVYLPYMYATEPCAPSPRPRRTRRGRPEGET